MVADEKQEEVLELIKKLLQLDVPKEEIINSLKEVGFDESASNKLIVEASKKQNSLKEDNNSIGEPKVSNLSLGDQISQQLGLEVKQLNHTFENKVNSSKTNVFDDGGLKVKSSAKQDIKNLEKPVVKKETNNSPQEQKNKIKNEFNNVLNKLNSQKQNSVQNKNIKTNSNKTIPNQTNASQSTPSQSNASQTNVNRSNPSQTNSNPIETNINQKRVLNSQEQFKQKEIPTKVVEKIIKNVDFSDLWKEGIMVAINSKLVEMKNLRDEIDSKIDYKIDFAVRKETTQLKVLLESQKELMISSNKEALEQKQNEITKIIDSKIIEIKNQSNDLSSVLKQIEDAKSEQQEALENIQFVLQDAKKTKAKLIVEMNSEIIKSKSQAQEFIDTAKENMKELDARVSKTLAFEKNVAEGLIEQAQQKVEEITINKADDLIEEIQLELNKLKIARQNINVEGINQKVEMLDRFKNEFISSINNNLNKINGVIKDLNEKNKSVEGMIEDKELIIDAKIEELTNFEQAFTKKLEQLLNTDLKKLSQQSYQENTYEQDETPGQKQNNQINKSNESYSKQEKNLGKTGVQENNSKEDGKLQELEQLNNDMNKEISLEKDFENKDDSNKEKVVIDEKNTESENISGGNDEEKVVIDEKNNESKNISGGNDEENKEGSKEKNIVEDNDSKSFDVRNFKNL